MHGSVVAETQRGGAGLSLKRMYGNDSFDGVGRFKNNVSNLGGLMEDIDLKITSAPPPFVTLPPKTRPRP